MNYKKNQFLGGKWAVKKELFDKGITKAKIVSETNPEPSNFKDNDGNITEQDVCMVRFQGVEDSLKIALNRVTINALVDAFGENSADWQGKTLSVEIDKVPGNKYYFFLIPEGYKRMEDMNGYSIIIKVTAQTIETAKVATDTKVEDDEINAEDLPW